MRRILFLYIISLKPSIFLWEKGIAVSKFLFHLVLSSFLLTPLTKATVRHVPADVATIQDAISLSVSGDTVLVAPGTYKENINFQGQGVLVASYYILNQDPAYIASTIIDGSAPTDPNRASVVLFINGEDSTSVLEGFTITGGTGTVWQDHHNHNYYREGGGILTDLSSPTIKNNLIINNIANNVAGVSSAGGGGIRCSDGNPRIFNNVIMQNDGRYGGGIVLNYTGAIIKNNIIYKNSGGQDYGGSGVWAYANGPASKLLENNTIVENSSALDGGGVYVWSTAMTIHNNIIWANTAPAGAQILVSGTAFVTYCDVQGGYTGSSNINKDPFFTDTSFVLYPTSPCKDAGDPNSLFNDPADTANPGSALYPSMGTLRNDMGAYGGPGRLLSVSFTLHQNAPKPPTMLAAYSDYQTPASIRLTWHDPDSTANGSRLSNFKIRIYRNAAHLADVDSGKELYVDTNLDLHQQYHYYFRAITPADSSRLDSTTAFCGGSAYPAVPLAFAETDSLTGIVLHWKNPATQADNTPLNDFAYIDIFRDGILIDSLTQATADTSLARTYDDPVDGYHYYRIAARDNDTPFHSSALSDSLMGFAGLDTSFEDNFESGIGGLYRTGGWDTTSAIADSGTYSLTDSPSGPSVPGLTSVLLLPSMVLGPNMLLTFDEIAIVSSGSYCAIDISANHRKTFTVLKAFNWTGHPLWRDSVANPGDWYREHLDLHAYVGDTVTIRFRLVSGSSSITDGWYVDNIRLGTTPPGYAITISQDLQQNWNMVSLPVLPSDNSVDSLFPGAISRSFLYNKKYHRTDSLSNKVGYWIKSPSAGTNLLTGLPIHADTVGVSKGWNMIGSISDPIDTASIVATPHGIVMTRYLTYTGTSYTASATIQPGKAYWVKVSQSGSLILSGSGGANPQNRGRAGLKRIKE